MSKYNVIKPFKIAGQIHKPGKDPIELDDKVAKALVKSGALEPAVETPKGDAIKELLGKNAEDVIAALPKLEINDLKKLAGIEKRGDNRKTVLDAVDAEITARGKK